MHPLANLTRWLILSTLMLASARLAAQEDASTTAANSQSSVFARLRIPTDLVIESINREFHKTIPVDRVLLGTRSRGTAVSRGVVNCRTLENPQAAELQCFITGTITSQTCGTNGPAIIHSRAVSQYTADKVIFFDGQSFQSRPARICVATQLTITGIGSTAPRLRGRIVRHVASQRVMASHAKAEALTAQLTRRDLQQQIDAEFDQRIAALNQRLNRRLAILPLLSKAGFHLAIHSHAGFIDADVVNPEAEKKPPAPPVRSETGEVIELWLPIPKLSVPELPIPELPVPELPVPELPLADALVPQLPIPGLASPEREPQSQLAIPLFSSIPDWVVPLLEGNPRLKDAILEGLGLEREQEWIIIELSEELLNGAGNS